MASRAFLLIKNPSLHLERAALHLSLHPHRSFRLTYRNHTSRRSKSRVYAEVVCRKCGERIAQEGTPHLDTSTTAVRPLFPRAVHSLVGMHVIEIFLRLPRSALRFFFFFFFFSPILGCCQGVFGGFDYPSAQALPLCEITHAFLTSHRALPAKIF